jgi:hypothetical protein
MSEAKAPVEASWWVGHALVLGVCSAIVVVAAILVPTPDVVSLFGVPIPELCTYRRVLGVECPGCGLTRSFSFMAHGAWLEALKVNWMGPPFFAGVASQIPYRLFRLVRGRRLVAADG